MRPRARLASLVVAIAPCLASYPSWAHCDSLEGPVVQDARLALDKGDPGPVLKWVKRENEDQVREAFTETMAIRVKSDDARAFADRYFFETVVRVHRAGEGEGFTGLKPASGVDPGIAAADNALISGSATKLAEHMSGAVSEGIKHRLALVLERKKHAAENVEAGRQYVEAYVDYIHFVEGINRLISHGVPHKHHEGADEEPR